MDYAVDKNDTRTLIQKNENVITNTDSIAFFDFDGTITTKDTLFEILKFTKGKLSFYLGMAYLAPRLIAHKLNLSSSQKTKEAVLKYFLCGMRVSVFDDYCEKFVNTKLPAFIRNSALREIERHQKNNTQVIIVSASAENWIEPWCKKLGIDFITTRLTTERGTLTGKIAGLNCNGEEKAASIRRKFDLSKYKNIYAYGDTSGDKQMFSLATETFFKPFHNK